VDHIIREETEIKLRSLAQVRCLLSQRKSWKSAILG